MATTISFLGSSVNKPPTTLWLIEDDESYRNTIADLVNGTKDMTCERTFISCEEALNALSRASSPEIVLMDIGLPGISGIEGTQRIADKFPDIQVIMLTVLQDDEKVFQAIRAGAVGYLLKTAGASEILQAIRVVQEGGSPINARIARKVFGIVKEAKQPTADYKLTQRELEVLHLLVEGMTLKQIDEKLFISVTTVDTHVRNIYRKMQVHTRAELAKKATKENL
jgi:DNA-binding NarL/FixJ family response regulator